MKQRITVLMKFKRYTIILVAFVLLFGAISFVDAAPCQESGIGVWNRDPSCDQELTFEDPGVAELDICEYRIVSVGGSTEETKGWTSAGECVGSTWSTNITIYINTNDPVTGKPNCKDDGEFRCIIYQRAQDNFGNKSTDYDTTGIQSHAYNIDSLPPVTTISPNGSNGWENEDIAFDLSCNDAGSGCLATPNYGVVDVGVTCTVDKLDKTGTAGTISCSAGEKGCEKQVCYRSWDNSFHAEDVHTSNVFQIDVTAPTVTFFEINNTNYTETVITNSQISLKWLSLDTGGSNIDYHEIWMAPDSQGSPGTWEKIVNNAISSAKDNPANGIYWYGIHAIDNAGNCIDETGSHACGGVSFDELVSRTIQGPIKVIISGNASPTVSVLGTRSGGQASVGCVPAEGGVNCDSSSYRLKTYTSNSICSETYSDYTLTNPQPITFYTWMCAAAKDLAGNEGFSPNSVEFLLIVGSSGDDTPDTSIDSGPSDPTALTVANFTFSGTNSPILFQCKIDAEPWELCISPKSYPASIGAHTFQVKASNAIGEDPTPASWDWTVVAEDSPPPSAENQPPAIQDTQISSAGLIVKASEDIIFSGSWSDPDAQEQVKLLVCKDVLFGASCNAQGAWCVGASFTASNPATCTYTTTSSDDGNNTYNAYICDDQATCSSAIAGSFNVDAVAPIVLAFDMNPKKSDGLWISIANPNVTISWHISDDRASDSGLREVQVWRSSNGGASWGQIPGSPFAVLSDNWISFIDDSSAASGIYLYGIHIVDVAGNEITETEAGFSAIEVQVDKDAPITVISEPQDSTWWKEDFTVEFEDVDPQGGSGLLSCEYEYYDLVSGISSGVQTRSCGFDTSIIEIGSSPNICSTQGFNLCEVRTGATDNAGNFAESFANFGVDYTAPSVGIPSPNIAQAGIAQTFSTLVSDNVSTLSGCSFFWKESSSSLWSSPIATNITPDECGAMQDCSVSVSHTFLASGNYDIMFGCADFAQPEPNIGYGSRDVLVESLFVTLSADPTAGSINTKFNLSSQIAGTATGNANFKFDCTNDGTFEYEIDGIDLSVSDPGWVTRQGEKTKVIAPDTFSVKDICQYSVSDIYTANNLVERGTSSTQDTLLINIGVSDNPEAILLQDNNSSADYCFVSAPPIVLSWTFSDVNPGDTQSAYQVQVSTTPGFGSPFIDTGKVLSANSEYSPLNLSFDATYSWRVKVWDSLDNVSPFAEEKVAFTTPDHAYPAPDFTWTPVFPLPEEEIQFQDTTVFAPGSLNQSWLWSFGDGTTSTQQNPVHTYNDASAYVVDLKSTDDVGSCGGQGDIDGDGIPNEQDPDIDGDGILNENDGDIDGDGIPNGQDGSPNGSGGAGGSGQSGGSSGGTGGSGASIINVTLPFPDYQEISPF